MEKFGGWLHRVRRSADITLENLAKKTNSHKGYYSGIETGKLAPPSAKIIRRIAAIFHEDVRTLMLMAWVEKAPKELKPLLEEDYNTLWHQVVGRRRV